REGVPWSPRQIEKRPQAPKLNGFLAPQASDDNIFNSKNLWFLFNLPGAPGGVPSGVERSRSAQGRPAWVRASRASPFGQRDRQAAGSALGSLARALESRTPARSGSVRQCWSTPAATGRAFASPESSTFAQAASSAFYQSRAWPRSFDRAASSGF